MQIQQLEHIKNWFREYSNSFLERKDIQYPVEMKIGHTARVAVEMKKLSDSLELSTNDKIIAETTAWLHDVGRFPQVAKYGSMDDQKTEDHSDLALKTIDQYSVLDGIDIKERKWIRIAIENHNKFSIKSDLDEKTDFFCRLIRDADKLDIWRVIHTTDIRNREEELNSISNGLPEADTVSGQILDSIHNHDLAKVEEIRSRNDFRLLALAWVFDLNFYPTLQAYVERGIVDLYRQFLPDTLEVGRALSAMKDYAQMKLEKDAVLNCYTMCNK